MSAEQNRTGDGRKADSDDRSDTTVSSRRRQVLGGIGAAGLASVFGLGSTGVAAANENGANNMADRMEETYRIRKEVADKVREGRIPNHESIDFDEEFTTKVASYTKGLPHNDAGEVEVEAYLELVEALDTGDPEAFEQLTMGGERGLISPQAALCTELMGEDPHMLEIEAPPEFDSDEQVAETVEVYWQSLIRDVPFREYDDSDLVSGAIEDLSGAPGFGNLDSQTVFRTDLPGVDRGPYITQFLWKNPPLGVHDIDQEIWTLEPGVDYITNYDEWLANMRGEKPNVQAEDGREIATDLARADEHLFTDDKRYMCTGRDLAACVQRDMVYQPFMIAALVLTGRPIDGVVPHPEEIYDSSNPYSNSNTQIGFVNHGRAGVMDMIASVAQCAHSAAWFQKWGVHRRCRPEKYGGLIEATLNDEIDADHDIPVDKLREYDVLDRVFGENGSHVLTSAFPEGAPTHPAYPGGHSTVSGACVTVLKAIFNEDYAIPSPVQATADGSELEDWNGETLTVGGELNKLAMNVNMGGRQFAGVHYRSDHETGFHLGEEVAISFLEDCKRRFNENFDGWTFTDFDGNTVKID